MGRRIDIEILSGMNDVARPDALPDDVAQKITNMEYLGEGGLNIRKDGEEFGTDVSGNSLNTVIAGILPTDVLQISPPMYPIKKPTDMEGDFVFLVFGLDTPTYKLYLIYENDSNTYTTTQISITEITLNINTYLNFYIGTDRILMTDTSDDNDNKPFYVRIDAEGTILSGLFGLPAPPHKPEVEAEDFDISEYEENVGATFLDLPGMFQCVYTAVTEEGDESNPSPISNSRAMQFFKLDDDEGTSARWIDFVTISNLSIPNVTADIKEKLKFFNVYIRILQYTEGTSNKILAFSQQFEIIDKDNIGADTGNTYSISVPNDPAEQVSYENDIAPIAKRIAEDSGITLIGNTSEEIQIPFDFDFFAPIVLNNNNNSTYIDAVVRIRIYDENHPTAVSADKIDDLDFDTDFDGGGGALNNLEKIRIFDNELTSMLQVDYLDYTTNDKQLDIYVRIPLLIGGQAKTIYLAWAVSSNGVTPAYYQTVEYGQFLRESTGFANQIIFNSERLKNNDNIILSPTDFEIITEKVPNRYNANDDGELQNDAEWKDVRIAKLLRNQELIGQVKSIQLNGTGVTGDSIRYDNLPFTDLPDNMTFFTRLKYDATLLTDGDNLFGWKLDAPGPILAGISLDITVESGTWRWNFRQNNDTTELIFENLPDPVNTVGTAEYFILLSMSKDNKVSLFIGNLTNGDLHYEEKAWSEWDPISPIDANFENVEYIVFGWHDAAESLQGASYDQLGVIKNRYLSANDVDDVSTVYNMANLQPAFEQHIGYKFRD